MIHLQLIDLNDNVYNFPDTFFITSMPSSTSKSIKKISFYPGGRNVSDGFLNSREIIVEGTLLEDTRADLEDAIRDLEYACLKAGKLVIFDDEVDRYITVSLADINRDIISTVERFYSISFTVEFPFWEDNTETEQEEILAGNDSFTVDLTGSDYLVYPEIEIENDQSADNPAVLMRNVTDSSLEFQYNDANFYENDILVINSKNGTVKKNNSNAIEYFNPGKFLRLQPVENTIVYNGAAATIRIRYRKVYSGV